MRPWVIEESRQRSRDLRDQLQVEYFVVDDREGSGPTGCRVTCLLTRVSAESSQHPTAVENRQCAQLRLVDLILGWKG